MGLSLAAANPLPSPAMMARQLEILRRGLTKPPHVIARWLWRQAAAEVDQLRAPARARDLTYPRLLARLGAADMETLWAGLAAAPFPAFTGPATPDTYESACPGDGARIRVAAEAAAARRVDLLGSGPVALGAPIDWHRDFKSGLGWPLKPFRRLAISDLDRPSDIKVPWELSRLQWLVPLGQAYVLDGDDGTADAARGLVEEWIAANPLARGVNWACTMDVALRGIALVWLFRAFHGAPAWADAEFRFRFLKNVYLHCDFTARHLEWSDVNGNHLLADAAGLVVMGLFLDGAGGAKHPRAWADAGWRILTGELPRQVFADGVDFEVSTAYQRLALELFLIPALCRRARGLDVAPGYGERVKEMARFVAHYCRADGSAPLWGDADDGRVLPFGPDAMTDHRYLVALTGLAFNDTGLIALSHDDAGSRAEVSWWLGPGAVARLPAEPAAPGSKGFAAGGVYVMRQAGDHVFIDAGPVGMAGRGGHGHNDCLSLEAALLGETLLGDGGAYVYTADKEWRNSFRSSAFHNTPIVDGEEINRFAHPDLLWVLRDDATPEVRHWQTGEHADTLIAAHTGYRRLDNPVTVVRGVMLEKATHRLLIADRFEGTGTHDVRVPYHVALGVDIDDDARARGTWRLTAGGRQFVMIAEGVDDWQTAIGEGWVSPSYGVKHAAPVLNFIRTGALKPLRVAIAPAETSPDALARWLGEQAATLERLG